VAVGTVAPLATDGAWLQGSTPEAELRLGPGFTPTLARLAPGRLQLLNTALTWREASWTADATGPGQLNLLAQLETIDVAQLLAKLQPGTGWAGNLSVGGRIALHSAAGFDADIVLERLGGDLTLPDELDERRRLPLGLSELRLALSAHDGIWQFAQGFAGDSIGRMAGAQVLRTTAARRFPPPEAPLSGVIEAQVGNLGAWGAWVPPGWRLVGQLHTSASFGGTLGAPEVSGEMRGSGLGLRNLLLGVSLSDGELAITLAGDRARVERFSFKGGDGTLALTGDATLGAAPLARLQLKADKFRLLGRIDRRLVASGQAAMQLGADSLHVDGDLRVDEGLFDISRSDAPTLDDDVRVHNGRNGTAPAAGRASAVVPAPLRNAQVAVRIDLGDRLRLRGHGIDTGLRGKLVASSPGGRFALNGSVRTEGGQFAAYGQKLQIRRGEFDFSGAPDAARIDVQAVRPNLDVVVGVLVTGTAQTPRIRLFSEPDLPDYDKLSWLMLGRAPDGLGRSDTALLQRAAMALLAGDGGGPTGKLIDAIGLTDFGLSQTDGDTRDTVITLGKQLSERWYVGYERSVNAAAGTWQLIYRAAQRFTLRAQSGSDNALDVIWSWRW
jgi:translocation and assembly module TamB